MGSNLIREYEEQWEPWLELKTEVPWRDILNEFNVVKDRCVPHRPTCSKGWYGLTLHGIKPEWTEAIERYPGYNNFNDSTAPYRWTEIAEKCPITKKYLQSLPFVKFGRVRFMLLAPSGEIYPHRDTEKSTLKALNISVDNPIGCEFNFYSPVDKKELGRVPFVNGSAFFVNIGLEHEFINKSKEWRLHIIIHGQTSNQFNNYTKDYLKFS